VQRLGELVPGPGRALMTGAGGERRPKQRLGQILVASLAGAVERAQAMLGPDMTPLRRQPTPAQALRLVLGDAMAISVEQGKVVGRGRRTGAGSEIEPMGGRLRVSLCAAAPEIAIEAPRQLGGRLAGLATDCEALADLRLDRRHHGSGLGQARFGG